MAKQTVKYTKTTTTRVRKKTNSSSTKVCPTCKGSGRVKK